MEKNEKNIKELAKGILAEAKEKGFGNDPAFLTSYKMVEVQVSMLDELEKSFKEDGTTITKEYVKGRENIYVHPAIDKYTKISDSCFNKIMKLKELLNKNQVEDDDVLDKYIND